MGGPPEQFSFKHLHQQHLDRIWEMVCCSPRLPSTIALMNVPHDITQVQRQRKNKAFMEPLVLRESLVCSQQQWVTGLRYACVVRKCRYGSWCPNNLGQTKSEFIRKYCFLFEVVWISETAELMTCLPLLCVFPRAKTVMNSHSWQLTLGSHTQRPWRRLWTKV